jgi:uncharacterized SAM-binding protein YcdF (DUF218 family)
MESLVVYTLKALMLPPGINLLVTLGGLAVVRWWWRLGVTLIAAALVTLYILSMPQTALRAAAILERAYPPLDLESAGHGAAGAIVVLGAGRYPNAPEFSGRDTVSRTGLERLRYAAHLYVRTGLPILVAGGRVFGEAVAEAGLMREVLENDFKVPVRWSESDSRNTAENAMNAARVLANVGVRRVLLVTHAAHMPRAVKMFQRAGLDPIPAPIGYSDTATGPAHLRWLPASWALALSSAALHEYLGMAWYAVRYRRSTAAILAVPAGSGATDSTRALSDPLPSRTPTRSPTAASELLRTMCPDTSRVTIA